MFNLILLTMVLYLVSIPSFFLAVRSLNLSCFMYTEYYNVYTINLDFTKKSILEQYSTSTMRLISMSQVLMYQYL